MKPQPKTQIEHYHSGLALPRIKYRGKSALLFAVIVSFVAGCAGKDDISPADAEKQVLEDLRTEIREAIDDPAREDEAIALVKSFVVDLGNLREKVSERRMRVRELNADYDTTRAEFEAFFEHVDGEIRSNKRQVWNQYREILSATTPEERAALTKVHTKAMNAAIRHIQSI